MNHPILDPQAIARLHRIGGDALVNAMLESFEVNAGAGCELAELKVTRDARNKVVLKAEPWEPKKP